MPEIRSCRVSYLDPDGIRHSVEVTAETLYEAAVLGIKALQLVNWSSAPIMMEWANDRVFAGARDGGWLEALYYYSGRNPLSERIWRQWEHMESEWRTRKPERYPTFDEWQKEAVKAVSATREDQTAALVPHYIEWEAFAFWARSVVEVAHGIPVQLAAELNTRCPGFLDEARATGNKRG